MGDLPLLGLVHVLFGAGLSLHILLRKRRPVSAVLWIAVVWFLPYLGEVLYLSFGVDRVHRGAELRREAKALLAHRAARHPALDRPAGDEVEPGLPASHIFRATEPAVRPNRVLRGNRAELLVDGDAFFPRLIEDLETARSSVHFQTFIYRPDGIGRRLRALLERRAAAGVDVRLLYDRFGSTRAHYTRFFDPLRRAGARVHSITHANFLKGHFQVNLRNHRKVIVVDGRVAYVGGINVHDENLSEPTGGSPIRDWQVRLGGPAVTDLQFHFLEDWHYATREAPERLLDPRYFPPLDEVGDAVMQVVPGGPEVEGRGLADAVFAAVAASDEWVDIVTPYFVPDEPIVEALRYAAMRGVRVRLVVPRANNHWYIRLAARALYEPLLEAGVRVFEREPPFVHAKALVVDGEYAMLGSANLDYRSLYLNFEMNVEVADRDFVRRVGAQVQQEVERSAEIRLDAWRTRPLGARLAENFCFLFQPML